MNTSKSYKEQTVKMNKAFSMRFRYLATVIFAILAATIFVGGLSIYEVDLYIQEQAESFVAAVCDRESAQINDSLRNMEKSVKIMESYLMEFFETEEDVKDHAWQEAVIQRADKMFVDVAQHTSNSGATSYYFRLDPEISHSKAGLFYSKLNGTDQFVSHEITDLALYEKDDTEHVGWFWQPYEAGKPIWMKPYHNQNNNILMISYVIPMYLKDTFIGVVGMDFDYMVLSEQVYEITIYENGFAHLESDGVLVCNENHFHSEVEHAGAGKYLQVSEELVNGMTLVISASYDDIRQIRYEITRKILLTALILLSVFMVIVIVVVQKLVDPLRKLTDASVKLAKGDYNVVVAQSSILEIRLLSTAFENMTTRLREREEQLRLTANRDSMTGLRNTTSYAAWAATFDKEIAGKEAKFGVVLLDLNDLKKTNDAYGHDAGNELIVTAAKTICEIFKRSPVFRIGGDEFLAVLQGRDLEERETLFAQFKRQCADIFIEKGGVKIPLRIAWGYADFEPGKDQCFADVFKRADTAMYINKRESKCGKVFD